MCRSHQNGQGQCAKSRKRSESNLDHRPSHDLLRGPEACPSQAGIIPTEMLQVVEAFSDYTPVCDARSTIEDLLASAPAETLAGLRTVVLTNTTALKGERKR